jgi:hypothetical protein
MLPLGLPKPLFIRTSENTNIQTKWKTQLEKI